MSSHSVKKIDQKEYLKKYLSGDSNKKKKKKVKKHKQKADVKVKIIDDDEHAVTELDIDEELLLTGEDAPQIVGTYVEENPNGAAAAVPKWKSIVIKDESDDNDDGNYGKATIKKEPEEDDDLWGPKARGAHRIKDEFSPVRRKSPAPDAAEPSRRQMRDERRRHRSRSRSKERRKKGTEERGRTNGNSDRDFSPSRRKNNKDNTIRELPQHSKRYSAERVRSLSSDQSPPRRRRKEIPKQHKKSDFSDISPRRRRKVDLEDQSPPRRRRRRDNSADQSPPRQKRHADLSPPRRKRQASNDASPPRRRNEDLSPPRRKREKSIDASPPRRRNADLSPPRRKRQASNDDSSPPRRRNADLSPPRRRAASPVKIKREKQSPDMSPVQRRSRERDASTKSRNVKREVSEEKRQNRWERREPSRSLSPPPTHAKKATKTLDGKRAGLQDAAALQKENQERRRREDEIFAKMSNEMSGRDAEVQVRSDGRRGRRARQAKELDPEEERRKEEAEKEAKELYERWGKGLKQIEDHRKKIDEEQYESSKPLARYSNDADLERHLREQERAEDPMLEYMRRKKKEKQKNSNEPSRPTYEGPYPENRFGIRPGYRWDGVDRSNGYEKKWFAKENEHRARQDEAYKYSVEDM